MALVDGIMYQRIGNEAYYVQKLLNQAELTRYLKNMLPATKAVYEYLVYDSGGVEKGFAEDLEKNDAVKVYAKLPGWFRVPTPLGTNNPDWAVLVELDSMENFTSWAKLNRAFSMRIYATKRVQKSNAANPTSRRCPLAKFRQHTWSLETSMT